MLCGGIPQIVKILKTKRSDGISITSYWLWVSSSLAYLIYVTQFDDFFLKLSCCIDFGMTSLVLILSYVYRGNK